MADEYSSWVGLIYVFNLIVGTGALTLPAVFAGAGWLLSTILVVLLAFVSFITVTFVIEAMACANARLHWKQVKSYNIDEGDDLLSESESSDSATSMISPEQEETRAIVPSNNSRRRFYSLDSKVELGEMARMYFNQWGRFLFYASLCTYLYGDLAIYATAIAKTVVDLSCRTTNNTEDYSKLCWDSSGINKINLYRAYVIIFAVAVGPFGYFQVQKTKYLQIVTTSLRWLAFLIMISLASLRLIQNGNVGSPNVVRFEGLPGLIGASVYSFMCHHSIPGLIAPFATKKRLIRQLFLDYFAICSFYLLLAITGSFAFAKLDDLYTLNFIPTSGDDSGVFMETLKYFLGTFPVFTLSTSFPIIAITLQNNLKSLFTNRCHSDDGLLGRLIFPTLAVLPPILVAFSTHNLKTLIAVTGSYAGVAIQYVIPVFLVHFARVSCKRDFGDCTNKYGSPFRHPFWLGFVLTWALLCIILVTVNFCMRGI